MQTQVNQLQEGSTESVCNGEQQQQNREKKKKKSKKRKKSTELTFPIWGIPLIKVLSPGFLKTQLLNWIFKNTLETFKSNSRAE